MNIARNPSSSTIPLSRQGVLPIKVQQLSQLRTLCVYTWQQEQYRDLPERSSRCRYSMIIERNEAMIADWLSLVSLNLEPYIHTRPNNLPKVLARGLRHTKDVRNRCEESTHKC